MEAVANAQFWSEALEHLGVRPWGKNHQTLRKWTKKWGIDTSHLPTYKARELRRPSETEVRAAVAAARSWSEALRRLRKCPTGGNPQSLRRWVEHWEISTDHFDPYAASRAAASRRRKPLSEVLVENSTFSRGHLKDRLYEEGLKQPICEICSQGEIWRGKRLSLILDHINGIRNDHRIENLRILCPNCAATLSTHCGGNVEHLPTARQCVRCGTEFRPKYRGHRYCSQRCGSRWDRSVAAREGRGDYGRAKPELRKVVRPPYEQLMREIEETSYLAVGRKYGVSDNAVRKWVRFYERQAEREAAQATSRDAAEATGEGDLAQAA